MSRSGLRSRFQCARSCAKLLAIVVKCFSLGVSHAESLLDCLLSLDFRSAKGSRLRQARAGSDRAFGARYVARGNAVAAHEDGRKERVVITEFPSLEQATAAYDSPAYQDALKALGDGAVRDVRIIEGME